MQVQSCGFANLTLLLLAVFVTVAVVVAWFPFDSSKTTHKNIHERES